MFPANDLAPDQAGTLEHQDVLRDGIERHREGAGDLGDGSGFLRQRSKNGAPGGIRHGGKNAVESLRGMFNHLVEYRPGLPGVSSCIL